MSHQTQGQGRHQLQGVLDDLVLQTKEKDIQVDFNDVDEDVEEAARDLIEYSSPRKRSKERGQRRKRKRMQKNICDGNYYLSEDEREFGQGSELVSLFGRQLNFTRLGRTPSLYAACREWIRSDPSGLRETQREQMLQAACSTDPLLFRLPSPESVIGGDEVATSAQELPVVDHVKMDASLNHGLPDQQMMAVKSQYIHKWKSVRKCWRESSRIKQRRYSESLLMLQAICQR